MLMLSSANCSSKGFLRKYPREAWPEWRIRSELRRRGSNVWIHPQPRSLKWTKGLFNSNIDDSIFSIIVREIQDDSLSSATSRRRTSSIAEIYNIYIIIIYNKSKSTFTINTSTSGRLLKNNDCTKSCTYLHLDRNTTIVLCGYIY